MLFLNIIVDWIPFLFTNVYTFVFNISQFFKSLEFLRTFYYNHYFIVINFVFRGPLGRENTGILKIFYYNYYL